MPVFKRLASYLPIRWQNELKRIHFGRQINKNVFATDEPEYKILHNFIKYGDWVIDIGANVGHYTKRFSELVGEDGRVIAFEPVPTTFSILAANAQLFLHNNITLINAAVSDKLNVVGMHIPKFATGSTNYYEAHLSTSIDSKIKVLTITLDSFCINRRVALVKIDVEGHEKQVIDGMLNLIHTSHPVLILETSSNEIISSLIALGYIPEKLFNSPNILFRPDISGS